MWVGVIYSQGIGSISFCVDGFDQIFHNCANTTETVRAFSHSTAWKIKERMSINTNTTFDCALWGGKLSDLVSHG